MQSSCTRNAGLSEERQQKTASAGKKPCKKTGMASIPTNTARTAPLDTSVKLGAAQQRALKDLVAMGFGKQACKEALLRTGTTSMDRLLAALTGPEEPPVRKRDAAGTPKAVPRPRPRPTPQRRAPPTAAPKVGAHLKHGDVRGVASKVYTKGNAHTWIDLKTTTGDVIEVRSTQVESIELTEDEVLACSKEMAPDDWLRLRVDGLVKLPSRQGVVGNRFTASDGSEKRQLVVEGSIIKCALCEDDDLGFTQATSTGIGTPPSTRSSRIVATLRPVGGATRTSRNYWRKHLERKYRWRAHRSRPRVVPSRRPFFSTGRGWREASYPWLDAIDADTAGDRSPARDETSPRRQCQKAGEARARRVPDATDDRPEEPTGLGAARLAFEAQHGLASAPPGLRRDEEIPTR